MRKDNQIQFPFGEGNTSPAAVEDVARVFAAPRANPQPHIGKVCHLTGPHSKNTHFYAQENPKALGPHDHVPIILVELLGMDCSSAAYSFTWATISRRWPMCTARDVTALLVFACGYKMA